MMALEEGMNQTAWRGEEIVDLSLGRIDTSYGVFRLVCPRADAVMERSVAHYGQLTPVVVGRSAERSRYELVDGFKRIRAFRKLGFKEVKVRILPGSERVLKAAIVHLNHQVRSISDMEEAMVLLSLYREDGLTQSEIAVLFGRHKSWVSRRIALVERLSDEVQEHLRLGLVRVGVGRELARLPRGNQETMLRVVLDHRLTHRETERLVSLVLSRPRWEHEALLRSPHETLEADMPVIRVRTDPAVRLCQTLKAIQDGCEALFECLNRHELGTLSSTQHRIIAQKLETVERCVSRLRILMQESLHGS